MEDVEGVVIFDSGVSGLRLLDSGLNSSAIRCAAIAVVVICVVEAKLTLDDDLRLGARMGLAASKVLNSTASGFQELRWKLLIDFFFRTLFWKAARMDAAAALAVSVLVVEYVDDATEGERRWELLTAAEEGETRLVADDECVMEGDGRCELEFREW